MATINVKATVSAPSEINIPLVRADYHATSNVFRVFFEVSLACFFGNLRGYSNDDSAADHLLGGARRIYGLWSGIFGMLSLLQQVIQECFVSTRVANIELKPSRLLSSSDSPPLRRVPCPGPLRADPKGRAVYGKKGGGRSLPGRKGTFRPYQPLSRSREGQNPPQGP